MAVASAGPYMQVCTLLQTDNHASTSPLSFLQAGCPSCRPTNSVKALKARKGTRSEKTEWWDAGMVICLKQGADLHMVQLMPLPLTVSCFSEIQIGFTFLVLAHLGSPGKGAVKRVCVLWSYKRSTSADHNHQQQAAAEQ